VRETFESSHLKILNPIKRLGVMIMKERILRKASRAMNVGKFTVVLFLLILSAIFSGCSEESEMSQKEIQKELNSLTSYLKSADSYVDDSMQAIAD